MKEFFRRRPWIWIVLAFLILFTAWGFFFKIASQHQPETIPLEYVKPKP